MNIESLRPLDIQIKYYKYFQLHLIVAEIKF